MEVVSEKLTVRFNPDQPEHMQIVLQVWMENSPYAQDFAGITGLYAPERAAIENMWRTDQVRLIVDLEKTREAFKKAGLYPVQLAKRTPKTVLGVGHINIPAIGE